MSEVILITGTRKGLGHALAEHYLAAGWIVAGCSRGAGTITHERYTHHELDIADDVAVATMVRATARAHGRIDALVNNAGIAAMNHLTLTPSATARRILDTNTLGTFYCVREVAKVMTRARRGRIVNFTTVATPLHLEGEALYAASKAAVESFTQIAARELAPFGITVNAVGPTPIDTDLIRGVPADKLAALIARQAIPRRGEPRDVINAVDFFLQASSDFITGQILYLGGITR